jgi:outer membrane protein TolC
MANLRAAAACTRHTFLMVVVIAALGLPPRSFAEALTGAAPTVLPSDPVLDRLIEEALSVRPELRGAVAVARAERERVPQAGALPDPTLTFGIQNDGFNGLQIGTAETSFWQVLLTQPLPWPGKRGLRTDAAELGARQADASVARARLTTEADVRREYLGLLLARDRLALLGNLEAIWQKSAGIARTRYESGEAAQSDVLRAQLELNRLRQRRWNLEAEERARVQALNRLRAHPLDEPIATTTTIRDLPIPALPAVDAAVSDAESRSPELAAARLAAEQASKSAALSRRERFPDFAITAGIMPRGSLEPMWTASIGVTLPIWIGRKQNRAVAESEARADSGAQNADAIHQILTLRVQDRRTALAALLDSLRLYREGLLVQSRATADSTLAQYQVGRVTFASVLEANVGYINDEDGYLQSAAEAQRIAIASAEVSLETLGGTSAGALSASSVPGAGGAGGGMTSGGASASGGAAGGAPPSEASSSSSTPKM